MSSVLPEDFGNVFHHLWIQFRFVFLLKRTRCVDHGSQIVVGSGWEQSTHQLSKGYASQLTGICFVKETCCNREQLWSMVLYIRFEFAQTHSSTVISINFAEDLMDHL